MDDFDGWIVVYNRKINRYQCKFYVEIQSTARYIHIYIHTYIPPPTSLKTCIILLLAAQMPSLV